MMGIAWADEINTEKREDVAQIDERNSIDSSVKKRHKTKTCLCFDSDTYRKFKDVCIDAGYILTRRLEHLMREDVKKSGEIIDK